MTKPMLFGADDSVYVRAARLALLEKGVAHDLTSVDVFSGYGPPKDHFKRHPFGRIPAFQHGDFDLFETGAITRYVDEAFEGPSLQPQDVRARARLSQIISIADSYVYPNLVWGIYVELVEKPKRGEQPDPSRSDAACAIAPLCLQTIGRLRGTNEWLVDDQITLADLHLAPMIDYFLQWEAGATMLQQAGLSDWWERMSARPSMRQSIPTE